MDAGIEEALGTLSADQRRQFRLLLRALEQPPTIAALIGRFERFSSLIYGDREVVSQDPLPTTHYSLISAGR